ncbi:PREDICTED: sodium- and chloride-dependent glycine transporter 2-like [Dinoponera quadriceps]|uniref:Sodium- and chloride-dependent glycine transporter 2-like n=1 Tax=Dinoponera quadriceps TaxID=609295 RepID=A0A6P3XLW6_DINQU|nr:PREDICTED: sodium- and chloride-dependent glycine transporter 2-like [Dinoponera quadriceps]
MLITMGLPIFYLELCLGQYTAFGPIKSFSRMAPAFHGVGYSTLVVIALVIIYYMVIVAWTLFYTFASFLPRLAWAYCDNDFNTKYCYSGLDDINCQKSNTMFFNKTCMTFDDVCMGFFNSSKGNSTGCFKNDGGFQLFTSLYTRILSSEEYYSDYVLGIRGATWENFGSIRWEVFGCLTLAWVICCLCLIRGVQSVGKIVYFTALFPYVILIALLIRGVTLGEGATDGILWYITPDWSTLKNAKVWGDAASQIFYSLGISCGSLITLSSYSKFNNNCHRDAIFVSITNLFTSVFAGFVIFSVLGFLAQQMHMPINKVVQSGPGLAFIAYPEAVARMPLPNLWAVLFFFMLFVLGLGSQFAGVQAINTAILDKWPNLRKREGFVIIGICIVCWLLAIPMVYGGGIYMFTLMDWNTASWAILLIGVAEVVEASWCYGCNKFLDNVAEMGMHFSRFFHGYWWLSWVVLAPLTCLGIFIYQTSTYTVATYGSYKFPKWADAIGILIGLSTLAPMPIFFVIKLWQAKNYRSLFQPSPLWGPATKRNAPDDDSDNTAVVNPAYDNSSDKA